jgi:hypothetical protein
VIDRRGDHGVLERADDGWTLRRRIGARHGRGDLCALLYRDSYDIREAQRRRQVLCDNSSGGQPNGRAGRDQ